jgi:hypothetical protein
MWLRRASAELGAGLAFAHLDAVLADLGADPAVRALAARAVDDERRHAEICRHLAGAYLAAEVDLPPPVPESPPADSAPSDELRQTIRVVSLSCVSETVACAFLDRCRAEATCALVRAALRALFADEIDHARLGWAHLASARVTGRLRRALGACLGPLLEASLAPWRAVAAAEAPAFPGHGRPAAATIRRVVDEAVADLVLPGLARLGIPA